jgi:hypothetical protein
MHWTSKAVSKHARRRHGAPNGCPFDFRRRRTDMGGLLIVLVACVVCGAGLGNALCRVLGIGG